MNAIAARTVTISHLSIRKIPPNVESTNTPGNIQRDRDESTSAICLTSGDYALGTIQAAVSHREYDTPSTWAVRRRRCVLGIQVGNFHRMKLLKMQSRRLGHRER